MRRDQNDHAKTNSQTPEPEGSGRKHCKTELPMRLLDARSSFILIYTFIKQLLSRNIFIL
jgi:hypothetical protein